MNTNTLLTDATIEAALARSAARVRGDGLHAEIMADVATTPQARRPLVVRPGWLGRPGRLAWPASSPRRIGVVALVALLLALVAGSLLVGYRPEESRPLHPAVLVPTGVESVVPNGLGFQQIVADAAGTVWTSGEGVLARFDPASGMGRTWTYGDDAAFERISDIVAAREGGVWLVDWIFGGQELRWFDGVRFRDVVPGAPGNVSDLIEMPDGSLWAGTDTGLFRWDGLAWSAVSAGRTATDVSALAIDRNGVVWVGDCDVYDMALQRCIGQGVSRYDGTRFQTYRDQWLGSAAVTSIEAAPDGSILMVLQDGGLVRYDGHAWTEPLSGDHRLDAGLLPAMVTAAPDGTIWVGGTNFFGLREDRPLVARYDGQRWVEYGSADGLPTTWSAAVAATSNGVYAATDGGLYRLVGDRWEPASPAGGPSARCLDVVAVSHDETLAVDDQCDQARRTRVAWRYIDGAWSEAGAAVPDGTRDLARAADGTLVAATTNGMAIRQDGRWIGLGGGQADIVAIGRDGTVRLADTRDPTIASDIRGFRLDDPTHALPVIPGPPMSVVESLAVGTDGSIWAGQTNVITSDGAGLYRYRDGRWERVLLEALDQPDQWAVTVIDIAPNGDVWVVWDRPVESDALRGDAVARYDGSTWTVFETADGRPVHWRAVAVDGNGTAWAATDQGLGRFDGADWTLVHDGDFGAPMAIAPDGTIFVAGPSGLARITDPGG